MPNDDTTVITQNSTMPTSPAPVNANAPVLHDQAPQTTPVNAQTAPAPHVSIVTTEAEPAETKDTQNASFSSSNASLPSPSSAKAGLPTEPEWQQCIQRTIDAIVSIRFAQVMAFDTDGPTTSEATGFIVDAKKGIILTNRHVVCAGPFVGEAILHNHEEVSVTPIYRDPVHDFGFLRFDPAEVKYMNLVEIPLDPRRARVGLDIRVVGNDAGEKLSILAGSISRLDRNAPDYGDGNYNDFNTFYLQAAASATGGSSGSPVIDIQGYAVGLQAGGRTNAATDYFLPLDRVKRALSLVQEGLEIKRGTMEVQFLYKPFDETRRLGLTDATEREIRTLFPTELGLLVVERVLPKGPGSALLEEGDVLFSVNGQIITKFVQLDEILDDGVGTDVELVVERGGQRVSGKITVEDLHSITPDRFLECAGSVITPLSYQLARAYSVPIRGSGVYLAQAWGMLDMRSKACWMVSSLDNTPTPDLDSFIEVFKNLPDRKRVPVKYYALSDIHATFVKIVQVERHWSGFKLWTRDDATGLWNPTEFDPAPPSPPPTPSIAKFITLPEKYGPARNLMRSMVKIQYWMPFGIDGLVSGRKNGSGLVVDAERGLIATSRHLIPFALGDVTISFAESVVIPGEIIYQHPTHNIAFVKYDPKLVEGTDVATAVISETQLQSGDRVQLVAYNYYDRPIIVKTEVSDICSDVTIPQDFTPRWRSLNFDYIMLNTPLSQECSGGVLANDDGHVQGLWLTYLGDRSSRGGDNSYYLGLDIRAIMPILEPLRQDLSVELRCLNVEVTTVSVEDAREMGLSDEYVAKVHEANEERRHLFMVKRTETGSESSTVLKDLDVVLEINGKVITRMYEFDVQYNNEFLDMVVLRDAQELRLRVPTSPVQALETSRIVVWAGGIFQVPHKAVRQQSKKMPSEVYLTTRYSGSPVSLYGLDTTRWITAINGKPVETLDDFLAVVRECPDNTYVRVKAVNFEMAPSVMSVKQNLHYWPTSEMVRDSASEFGWRLVKQ